MTRFTRKQDKNSSRRRSTTRSQMQFEQLERREVYVVGAFGIPAAVPAGIGFDGVVQLGFPNNGCTGSLLWTGRHILTAAHCVDQNVDTDGDGFGDRGDDVIDAGTATVVFDMPTGPITLTAPMTNVRVPDAWNGRIRNGNDIAILTLDELAPSGTPGVTGAERYGIYTRRDEVPRVFTFVGYGSTNPNNTTFDNSGPGGTKRSGQNQFDSASGTVLNFDFNSDDLVTIPSESNTAPGDSGGPSFLDGLIAGVTSGGTRRDSGLGDNSFNTRVSSFADWINTTVGGSYDLVLDMDHQVAGDDSYWDLIKVQRNGANLEIVVNNTVYHSDLAVNIRSVTLRGSTDDDVFVFSTPVAATVDGRTGSNSFAAPGQLNGWKISGANAGEIGNWARFSNVQNLKGGTDVDIFQFESSGRVDGTIRGGGGDSDALDYSRLSTPVEVTLADGRASRTGGVIEVENVKGGSGDDLLIGNDANNSLHGNGGHDILDGAGGNDSLYGNAGHDLLIGGLNSDLLDGGADNDILIAGRLTANYRNIRREWIRQDIGYYSKVSNLRLGTGLTSGSQLTSSSVQSDVSTDHLTGGTGDDWFWGLSGEVRDRSILSVYGKMSPTRDEYIN